MIFTESALVGAFTIEMDRIEDERGFFARTYDAQEFESRALPGRMPQSNVSFNHRRGTLRGLHFQADPHAEDKLVRCTAGAVFDVIVDLRPRSATHRRWFGTELTSRNGRSLFVPKGFAHGFITLCDESEVLYMMSTPFAAGFGRGVRWNDPALAIAWPMEPTVIADRDAAYPLLDASPP